MRRAAVVFLASLLATTLGACRSDEATTSSSSAASAKRTTSTVSDAEAAEATACTKDAIAPVVRRGLGRPEGPAIADVEVNECQNGFARVAAVPDNSTCKEDGSGSCYETEQVFLKVVDDKWTIFTTGTGIDCQSDEDLSAEMVEACESLGLR